MGTYIGKTQVAMEKNRAVRNLAEDVKRQQKKYDKMQSKIGKWNKIFDIASMATMLIPGVGTGVAALKAGIGKAVGKTAIGGALKKFGVGALKKTGLKALGGKMFKGAVGKFGKEVLGSALKRQLRQKGIEKLVKGGTKIGKIKSDSPFGWRAAEKYDKALQEGMKFSGWGKGFSENLMTSFIQHGGMEAFEKAKSLGARVGSVPSSVTDSSVKGSIGERLTEDYTTTFGQKGTSNISNQAVQQSQAYKQKFGGGDIAQRALPPTEMHKSYTPPPQYGKARVGAGGDVIFPSIPPTQGPPVAPPVGNVGQQLMKSMKDNPETWIGAGGTGGLLALMSLRNRQRRRRG